MDLDFLKYFSQFIAHFKLGISQLRSAIPFIRQHKLWKGMERHRWLVRVFIVVGIILGFKMFAILIRNVSKIRLQTYAEIR